MVSERICADVHQKVAHHCSTSAAMHMQLKQQRLGCLFTVETCVVLKQKLHERGVEHHLRSAAVLAALAE